MTMAVFPSCVKSQAIQLCLINTLGEPSQLMFMSWKWLAVFPPDFNSILTGAELNIMKTLNSFTSFPNVIKAE